MDKIDKQIRAFQQGELDAVLLYRGLSERMKAEEDQELLKKVAAEEGRHAAVCRGLTCVTLDAKSGLKNGIILLYRLLGKKLTFRLLSIGEKTAGKKYDKFIQKYDINEFVSVAEDEYEHGRLFLNAAKNKK